MVAQLRTYTINRGMMDSWLKVFDEEIRPIHAKIGMPISATYVNADRNEFIWIRNFNSTDEIPEEGSRLLRLRRAQEPSATSPPATSPKSRSRSLRPCFSLRALRRIIQSR